MGQNSYSALIDPLLVDRSTESLLSTASEMDQSKGCSKMGQNPSSGLIDPLLVDRSTESLLSTASEMAMGRFGGLPEEPQDKSIPLSLPCQGGTPFDSVQHFLDCILVPAPDSMDITQCQEKKKQPPVSIAEKEVFGAKLPCTSKEHDFEHLNATREVYDDCFTSHVRHEEVPLFSDDDDYVSDDEDSIFVERKRRSRERIGKKTRRSSESAKKQLQDLRDASNPARHALSDSSSEEDSIAVEHRRRRAKKCYRKRKV